MRLERRAPEMPFRRYFAIRDSALELIRSISPTILLKERLSKAHRTAGCS